MKTSAILPFPMIRNKKELTKFFEDLEKGKFQPGDVFALENIDRLTRRGPIDALMKVNAIISKRFETRNHQ
ncbi:hypothetical protein NHF39_09005 [Pseudomonas proteolytica]|nr:hypothetical protein NHF39_09005 [Pseudomonas proteolytica]